jgi:hypothetical protein
MPPKRETRSTPRPAPKAITGSSEDDLEFLDRFPASRSKPNEFQASSRTTRVTPEEAKGGRVEPTKVDRRFGTGGPHPNLVEELAPQGTSNHLLKISLGPSLNRRNKVPPKPLSLARAVVPFGGPKGGVPSPFPRKTQLLSIPTMSRTVSTHLRPL